MITREIRRGEVFADRYRVIRRLGAGGMATVWLAEDERLGREVAIKRLRTDAPEEALTRFSREARLGAALNHPNFVSVFDTVATDDGAMIVMEYVPGQSLEELAKRGRMDPEEVISILRGSADALDHAHGEGVVHRDIKPANVLVREDGMVKLADLGIARAVDATQITSEGKVIGTRPYMAPERMKAAGAGGPASDVYALAAVSFELLSGSSLDGAAQPGESPDRQGLAERWPGAPAAAFAVILRGLAPDPARRQSSAGEFVDELDDALKRTPEKTQPMTATAPRREPFQPPAPPARAARSRAAAVLAVTLVVLAGLTAAGIALVGGGSGGSENPKKEANAGKGANGASKSGSSEAASDGGVSEAAPAAESQASPASSPPPSSEDGVSLNAEGFSLIQQGRAAEAVPILLRAVGSFPEGTSDINYAYALYNLGNALRLSGHPEEAIPVLERRLEIPDQRSTVEAELARARADAGAG
jgi:eukaryotic-like serine/threonine-protein kinase